LKKVPRVSPRRTVPWPTSSTRFPLHPPQHHRGENNAGSEALTTYALAQRLAKRPETADLVPHVDDMRRALGISRKVKARPVPPAEPTPEKLVQ
jgi:hypothetical protein